jgi:hypothetical protein
MGGVSIEPSVIPPIRSSITKKNAFLPAGDIGEVNVHPSGCLLNIHTVELLEILMVGTTSNTDPQRSVTLVLLVAEEGYLAN